MGWSRRDRHGRVRQSTAVAVRVECEAASFMADVSGGLPCPAVRGRGAGGGSSSPPRADVDFRLARRRIEALTHYPPVRRARALAAYVGAFDLADADGRVDLPTSRIAEEFEIGVVSWLHLREVLEEAGLVAVDPHRGGSRRAFRLLEP